ncbi:DUF7093 family protein [Halorubrum sp. SY-15]|uniref:DUF7093 family protein n=1 Tax=Halorubrum sp. SY-15 TaxID=3402277 RepID=UPI003EBAE67A
MGLKCLLGHDYSAPEIERERVEDGDEVVTTLREVQTCARCGETRVVSENTEVTTMARLTAEAETVEESPTRTETLSNDPSPEEPSTDDPPAADSSTVESSADQPAPAEPSTATEEAPTTAGGPQASTATPETDEGVEFIEETAAGASASRSVTADPTTGEGSTTGSTTGEGSTADPADDGAEILESESPASGEDGSATTTGGVDRTDGRERGAWPSVDTPAEASAETDGEHRSWPTHDAEDEGYDASTSHSAGETGDEAVAYVGGPAAEASATARTDTTTGLERSRERRAASAEETRPRGPTEYYCPACEMTTDTDGSSLRAGDVCPECRGGYVAERSQ